LSKISVIFVKKDNTMAKSKKKYQKDKPKNHANGIKRRKIIEQNAKILEKLREE